MKKRILSMALIVAMVVAMIPAVLVNAFAAPYNGYGNGYDVYISETAPTLDGQMDAVYTNSEMIVNIKNTVHNGTAQGTSFTAYAVATASGFYVFADVKDSTVDVAVEGAKGAGDGDKVQTYMQVASTVSGTTQYQKRYFDCDYAHTSSTQDSNVKSQAKITDGGYTIEIFLPWTIWNGITLENVTVYFGIQVNNYHMDSTTFREMAGDHPDTGSYYGYSYTPGGGAYTGSGTTAPEKFHTKANLTNKAYSAPNDLKYKAVVTNEAINLDGVRDDIYLASQKITAGHVSVGTVGETTGFETYMVARENGIYVFASIYDDTLDKAEAAAGGLRIQDGDKFQIYLQLGNLVWKRWGYIDFDYVDGGRHIITSTDASYPFANTVDEIQQKAVLWEDGKGWDIEIFIPNSLSKDNRFNSVNGVTNPSFASLLCKVNFQALNETCLTWTASGYCETRTRYGLSYDIAAASVAYNGPTYSGAHYVPVEFSTDAVSLPGTGAITYGSSVSVDGVKDAVYGDDSVAFIIDREIADSCSTHASSIAKAWVVITDSKLAMYAEVYDETITSGTTTATDSLGMYVYFPLANVASGHAYGYARSGHWDACTDWNKDVFFSSNGQLHSGNNYGNSGRTAATKSLGNNMYSVEISVDLPAAVAYYLAQGETIEVDIALEHKDCCGTNGTIVCSKAKTAYNYGWTSKSYVANALPRYTVSKNSTVANMAVETKITGAQVALGDSITVNYYANLPASAQDVSMKFTMNDKVTFVQGVAESATSYKFPFEGIAPQCMSDNIKAELYVGGRKVAEYATYSVLQNVNNVKNDANKALVEALLHYGAAAQKYANYKTDALVNAGLTAPTYADTLANDQKNVGASTVSGAKFSAAGVYHANINKLYAKITVNNLSVLDGLTVTIDGKEAKLEKYSDGVYIVYSEGISVKNFDKTYTFVLTDANGSQTLTYSVNAYASVKWNAENAYTQELARAMYAYGVAAESYNG